MADRRPIDFDAVFRSAPDLYLLLDPALVIVDVSDGYLRATMTRREDILGRHVFDVFPDDPAEPGADGVSNLRASLSQVLATKRPHAMAVQRYPIRRPDAEGGGFEERYWSPLNTPVLRDDGWVAWIIHRVEDVTEMVRLKRENLEQDRTIQEISLRSQHYGLLLDTAPDAMVIVEERGRIELVNKQTEVLFGYTRDELVGQSLDLLIPERFRQHHADHMSRYFASPSARPMGSALQLFGRRKDASELPIEVSLSPQRDAHGMTVSASIRDITERKRLEQAASLTAERLRSAVDSIQDAFALFDAEDRLVLCNSVFRRLVHSANQGTLVGKQFAEILDAWIDDIEFPDAEARAQFRRDRIARRSQELTSTFDVRMRDGRSLRITDRRTPEGGIVKTIWDITDDERQAQELREARTTAETASAAKSDFLASMSHEVRTPLNAILGFAQLLVRDRREALSDRHLERVKLILAGGEHLLRLIDDILDLSRIEAGKVSISSEPVRVHDVLDDVRRTLEPLAARHGIAFEIGALPEPPPTVIADRTRLVQIVMNFGSNAVKYNRPSGSVRFTVTAPSPELVRITVSDTGFGIALDRQSKLFQPFQRAGQETGPIQGTGIGLVITKRLAELMGGSVGFRSAPDEGSAFWVDMPAHTTEVRPARSSEAPVRTATLSRNGGDHLVLYVEDNPANIEFMRDLVGTFGGIDLITAVDAERGIEIARTRRPEVVIMDINLPGMSGVEALYALRAIEETRDIPVIALTAAASERDRQRGRDAGFYRYLAKPILVDELIDALESLFQR